METIKETLQLMISLSQIQDVEVRESLGKIVSQNILFFVANFSVTVFKIDNEIQVLFNVLLTVLPATANPLNASTTTPVPATTTPPPFGT